MPQPVPLVRVVRSGLEESVHLGHVAVCDADGRVLASLGDPEHLLFARSSMKPLQAAVGLRHLPDLPADLVAVMCASHNAEPEHVWAVRRLLRSGGLTEAALHCPPDLPALARDARAVRRPRRIYFNCSGKHAGMVVASVAAGWAPAGYLESRHPLQRQIARAVPRATGIDRPAIGVDGCGVPVFGVPLRAMATLFARLSRPERLGSLAPSAVRAVAAMRAHPFLVAGTGRTDTVLMSEVPGVISKGGAEALHCAAVLEPGIGVAVKITDGGDRATGPALLRALELLGAISPEQLERLAPIARRPVLGGGRPVGALAARFRLRRPR